MARMLSLLGDIDAIWTAVCGDGPRNLLKLTMHPQGARPRILVAVDPKAAGAEQLHRAVEHHRALVRSTNSGVSALVDPVGRVIDHSGVFTEETLRAEVPLLDQDTVFTWLGQWPGWLSLAAIFWMSFVGRHPLRRNA